MPQTTGMQIDIVMYSILAGIITGILFDTYRIIRGFKIPKVILIIQDVLFWSLAALIIFTFLLYTNYAFLGVYVYVIMLLALLLYLKFISTIIFKIEKHSLEGITKIARVFLKNIIYPIKILYFNIIKDKNKKIT